MSGAIPAGHTRGNRSAHPAACDDECPLPRTPRGGIMHAMTMPRLRAPIVLVHGLFGFSRFQVAGRTMVTYWPGIPEAIEKPGNRVLLPAVSPTCGVADRAKQLKAFLLTASPNEPVHLVAHSMGGLDARYMISRLG